MNLVLIGYRGTGKTTVARLLAQRLGWRWFDSDEQVEARAGKSIAAIFADEGESSFRDWESQVVAELARGDNRILALGGGAVMRPENRAAIAAGGAKGNMVVWLRGSPEVLWTRIAEDQSTAGRRPNLTIRGGITEIIATLRERDPVYRQCSACEVDTDGKSPAEVADAILAQLDLR